MNVAIVDYGMGNLDSVRRALEECGAKVSVTSSPRDLETVPAIVLPGVGAFPAGMRHLRQRGLIDVLTEQVVERRIPVLGICLGMQLFAQKGWEMEETEGLGWISGEVHRLEAKHSEERIPHVGWNEVALVRSSPLFAGIPSGKDFYFVHSFHLDCRNSEEVLARTDYCAGFVSALERANIFGVQFHPEKSQKSGLQLFRNFLALCKGLM